MHIAFYSAKPFEVRLFKPLFEAANITATFITERLTSNTVVHANDCDAVCCFVTDDLGPTNIEQLGSFGVKLIALRSTGYDHVDLTACEQHGITVVNVPAYSPYAVAEFAVGLLLSLTRKIHHAHSNIQKNNFSLDSQLGDNLHGKTVGVIGTGNIGAIFCTIMQGFGCSVLGYDPEPSPKLQRQGVRYVSMEILLRESDVISLHCPLNDATRHLINAQALRTMKPGAIVINTGRGGLIDSQALLDALQHQQIAGAALDVYENEHAIFFKDHASSDHGDPLLSALQRCDNCLITGHQAYLTTQALQNIAGITVENCKQFISGSPHNVLINT